MEFLWFLVYMFQTDFLCCGVAPLGDQIVAFAYVENEEEEYSSGGSSSAGKKDFKNFKFKIKIDLKLMMRSMKRHDLLEVLDLSYESLNRIRSTVNHISKYHVMPSQ